MATKNVIEVLLKALDQTGPGIKSASDKFRGYGAQLTKIGAVTTGVGAAVSAAFTAITVEQAHAGDELAKSAKRLGTNVKALSELEFAAQQSGADLSALRVGLRRLAQSAFDASEKGGGLLEARRAFDELGISVEDSQGNLKPILTLFGEIADATSKATNATEKAALAQKVLGRSGDLLIPLLNEGATGVERLREEANRLGIAWTETEGVMAENVVDALNRVRGAAAGVRREIFAALAPAVADLATSFSHAVADMKPFVEQNRGLVKVMAGTSFALVGAGGVILALGQLSFAIGNLLVLLPRLTQAWIGFRAAALGPVGLAIGVVAASMAILTKASLGQSRAYKDLIDKKAAFIAESSEEADITARLAALEAARAEQQTRNNIRLAAGTALGGLLGTGAGQALIPSGASEEEKVLRRALEIQRETQKRLDEQAKALGETMDDLAESERKAAEAASATAQADLEANIEVLNTSLRAEVDLWSRSTEEVEKRNTALERAARFQKLLEDQGLGRAFPNPREQPQDFTSFQGDQLPDPGLSLPPTDVPDGLKSHWDEAGQAVTAWGETVQKVNTVAAQGILGVADVFGNTLRQAILDPKTSLKDLGRAFKELFAGILADLATVLLKFVIFKAILTPLGLGSFVGGFGAKDGGTVVRAADGLTVRGGISGLDSVPALLAPGERVIPAYESRPAHMSGFQPIQVTVRAGLLAGDEGTAVELARMVQEKLNYANTGVSL